MSINAQNIILQGPTSNIKRFLDNIMFIQESYPYIEMNLGKFVSYYLEKEEDINEKNLIDISSIFDRDDVSEKIKEFTLKKKEYHCYDTSLISEKSIQKLWKILEENDDDEIIEYDNKKIINSTLITEFSVHIKFPEAEMICFNARLYEHVGYGYCRQKISSNLFKDVLDIEVPEGCSTDLNKNYGFENRNIKKYFANNNTYLMIFIKTIDRLTNYFLYDKEFMEHFEMCGCDSSPIAEIISHHYIETECYQDYVNDI